MSSLVSVIIPSYNTGRYLPEALESVFAQSYPHYEIIVVDDGSTDETTAILQPYLARIQYLYQTNQGVSAARNHALSKANGEWLLFLDADDKLSPSKLEKQLAIANENTAILHSGWWLMAEDGSLISEVKPYVQSPTLDLETWLFWKPVYPAAMLFRRDYVEKVAGFDTNLAHAEDVDLVFRIAAAGGESLWLREATAYYRQREGSASTKSLKQAQSIERVLDKFFTLPQIPQKICKLESSVRYFTILWYTWRLLDDGYLEQAKTNLLRAKTLRKRTDEYLLLEWQAQYTGSADEFFASCLELNDATAILSGDFRQFSPKQQIDLLFNYIATRKNLPSDIKLLTQGLSSSGKLAAYLTLVAKSAKRKDWQVLWKQLPQLLRWTLTINAPYVYFSLLKRIRHEI
jgi:glycosyltransferase involved in cell wall biosynthesis